MKEKQAGEKEAEGGLGILTSKLWTNRHKDP